MNFEAKPYRLKGKIQNYDWGTKNQDAFIPEFLDLDVEVDKPYAEYWIGVHPKAPSEVIIDEESISFIDLLEKYPIDILGERIAEKFNNTLPYLLKILSINQALSIQSHPSKELAKVLHAKDPFNYPDDNHKPEIAIAIDNLTALVGLKSLVEVRESIIKNTEIKELLSENILVKINDSSFNEKSLIKELYSEIVNSSANDLERCILAIKTRLELVVKHSQSEKQFLIQYENYGIDVGLISILLFNIVNLKKGEAIFTPAGIPHAYIKGNIVECMANSDNVVRAGLTPKYQDKETLTDMLETDSSQAIVDLYEKSDRTIYKTAAEEFEIEKLNFKDPIVVENNSEIKIVLVLDGELIIDWNDNTEIFKKGNVILIPAALNNYQIFGRNNHEVFQVRIP